MFQPSNISGKIFLNILRGPQNSSYQLFKGLVVAFGPKKRSGRMWHFLTNCPALLDGYVHKKTWYGFCKWQTLDFSPHESIKVRRCDLVVTKQLSQK